jgi:hypothetical protein
MAEAPDVAAVILYHFTTIENLGVRGLQNTDPIPASVEASAAEEEL